MPCLGLVAASLLRGMEKLGLGFGRCFLGPVCEILCSTRAICEELKRDGRWLCGCWETAGQVAATVAPAGRRLVTPGRDRLV
jgi:hypothetical protein